LETLLGGLEGSALAQGLRFSRWSYAIVNTSHVLGIALLVGAIVPLDLRLLGLWRAVPLEALARVLFPIAAAGLVIAITAGGLLFIVRAREYAALDLFVFKLGLIGAGILHAVSFAPGIAAASRTRQRLVGATSLAIWLAVLVCGRMLAFVGD
jgi:hypothetical protein